MMSTSGARPPSVIVFFTDQQRADTVGALGSLMDITPNLDLMAGEGTVFEAACASNPVCAPARSAILTGRYPTKTGVWRNGLALAPDIPTMARSFKEAGYVTGYVGKWHLSRQNPVPQEERADWDCWLASNALEFTSDAYRTVMWDEQGQAVELPGYRADATVDAAIRFVADHADEPFFLFVSLIEPHHQNEHDDYPAPRVYRNTYTSDWMPPDLVGQGGTAARHIGGYYGQIKRVDEAFGRLRDVLESLEIADDTIVAYTADHGSHFKTRNGEYKRSGHDSSIRVPLVIAGPGFTEGERVRVPVSTVDLAATLLEAAGVEQLEGGQGNSLRRHFGRHHRHASVLVQVSESETGRAIRTERWMYYVAVDDSSEPAADRYEERELYDLDADPWQQDNLIDSEAHVPVVERLRERLLERIHTIEGDTPEIVLHTRSHSGRQPETTVRAQDIRGTRFGHQATKSGGAGRRSGGRDVRHN